MNSSNTTIPLIRLPQCQSISWLECPDSSFNYQHFLKIWRFLYLDSSLNQTLLEKCPYTSMALGRESQKCLATEFQLGNWVHWPIHRENVTDVHFTKLKGTFKLRRVFACSSNKSELMVKRKRCKMAHLFCVCSACCTAAGLCGTREKP